MRILVTISLCLMMLACGDETNYEISSASQDRFKRPIIKNKNKSKNKVKVTGPATVGVKNYIFRQAKGKGYKVEIDVGTIRACFAKKIYKSSKIGRNKFLVEVKQAMVPAVVCSRSMMKDIKTGITIDIPKSARKNTSNFSQFLVVKQFGRTTVLAKAKGKAKVDTVTANKMKLDSYTYMQMEGKAFSIDIDKKTVKKCYAGVAHQPVATKSGYFVNIRLMPNPRIPCKPSRRRDIQLGTTIDVPSKPSFTYGKLYVEKDSGYGKTVVFR